MDIWKHAGYNVPQKQLRVSSSTQSPETVRPRQVAPTQQPSRFRLKNGRRGRTRRATISNLPSRRWQVIITYMYLFPCGSVVERPILDEQLVSSNLPPYAVRFFSLNFFLLYASSKPPVSVFFLFVCFTTVLLWCCCTVVQGSWVFIGRGVFSAVYCFTAAVQRTAVLL